MEVKAYFQTHLREEDENVNNFMLDFCRMDGIIGEAMGKNNRLDLNELDDIYADLHKYGLGFGHVRDSGMTMRRYSNTRPSKKKRGRSSKKKTYDEQLADGFNMINPYDGGEYE